MRLVVGRVAGGHVRLPVTITRPDVAEMCASEVLTAEWGRLVWRPVPGRANHLWDGACLAVHGRRFRPLSAAGAVPAAAGRRLGGPGVSETADNLRLGLPQPDAPRCSQGSPCAVSAWFRSGAARPGRHGQRRA